jgi:hypothetical protein
VVKSPDIANQSPWGGFGVSPAGDRFLLYQQMSDAGESDELIVIVNWFADLERLVGDETSGRVERKSTRTQL